MDAPSAKLNYEGLLISDTEELENLYLQTYVERLIPNHVPENLKETEKFKHFLFSLRLKAASEVKIKDWTLEQLEKVLKST